MKAAERGNAFEEAAMFRFLSETNVSPIPFPIHNTIH